MIHGHDFQAAVEGEVSVADTLALLAAGIDTRFLQAGTTLAGVVDTIDGIIGGLDGIAEALDRQTAGAAVADLLAVADTLSGLPVTQESHAAQMADVARIARALEESVLQMNQELRILAIYGMNIKIAASGEAQFVAFVNGMLGKLTLGETELGGFLTKLKELREGVGGVQRAERLLAVECGKIVPHVPDKLARDAGELDRHLTGVAEMAARTATIARGVQQKVAVVLGALQVGDRTRQRLEHVVTSLQMIEADRAADGYEAAAAHIDRMLSAQLDAAAAEYGGAMTALVRSLAHLDGDLDRLCSVIATQSDDGKDRGFLGELEGSITDIHLITSQLRDAESRSREMGSVIAATVAELSGRLDSVRRIRMNVQDIATNTRLLCRRHGATGKAVAVVATEVDAHAIRLGDTTNHVATSIGELSRIDSALHTETGGGGDIGTTLANALRVIREGCDRTAQITLRGEDDVLASKETVGGLHRDIGDDAKLRGRIEACAALLSGRRPETELDDGARTLLTLLLPAMGRLYTMVEERDVHARFLLPGMAADVPAEAIADDDDDDGLF